ncbi:MAG: hypothetical protein ABW137_22530, partial [Mycobacterium sp.]
MTPPPPTRPWIDDTVTKLEAGGHGVIVNRTGSTKLLDCAEITSLLARRAEHGARRRMRFARSHGRNAASCRVSQRTGRWPNLDAAKEIATKIDVP